MGDCKLTLQFDDNCVHNKFVLFPFSLRRFIPMDAETKNNLYFSPAANYRRVRRGPTYYFMNPKMSCYFQRRYKAIEIERAARLQGEGEDRRRQGGGGDNRRAEEEVLSRQPMLTRSHPLPPASPSNLELGT